VNVWRSMMKIERRIAQLMLVLVLVLLVLLLREAHVIKKPPHLRTHSRTLILPIAF